MIERCFYCGNWVRQTARCAGFLVEHGEIVYHQQCRKLAGALGLRYTTHPGHPCVATEHFTSTDEHGKTSVFDVYRLREICKATGREIVPLEIPPHVAEAIREKNEVSNSDAQAVCYARYAEGTLHDPLMIVVRPDGHNFLIDGSHRLVGAYLEGVHKLPGWVLSWEETDNYRIDGWDPAIDDAIKVN